MRFTTLLATLFSSAALFAQTSDLVFFSDDGTRFTLVIDGDVKNERPAARVVATGIRTETPMVLLRFEDASVPEIRRQGYFPLGKEYTLMVTTNKKGAKVFRPTGEAPLGTAAGSTSEKPRPTDFKDDAAPGATPAEPVPATGVGVGTTIATPASGESVNMNIGMNVNGVNMNMSVNVSETTMGGTSTTGGVGPTGAATVATTATAPRGTPAGTTATRPTETPTYAMPGYTGLVGCPWPMSASEFNDAKTSIGSKNFEDMRLSIAKQVATDRCFTVEQVKGIMGLFNFEDSKLDFAKFAYDHTYDVSNYFKVNDAFTYESSIEELDTYIKGR